MKSQGKIREFDGIKQVILIQVKTVAAGKLQIIETSMMLTIALFNDSKHIVKLEAKFAKASYYFDVKSCFSL